MPGAYSQHLTGPKDLVTTHEATRAGFIELALEKNRQATPVITKARALLAAVRQAATPADLLKIPDIEAALLTAAGVSDKASKHLNAEDKKEAIKGLITNFLEPAGAAFPDEAVYRYLLISGDTLGGSMRNVVGVTAKRRFVGQVFGALKVIGFQYLWQHQKSRTWIEGSDADLDIEPLVRAVAWTQGNKRRVLVVNAKVPLVQQNIDLCLLQATPESAASGMRNPASYLALGELKGGIDPAGADEHWKTAGTALARIRREFAGAHEHPATFFVGGAIVENMAGELWAQLQTQQLTNAANLTNVEQVASLCGWLVRL